MPEELAWRGGAAGYWVAEMLCESGLNISEKSQKRLRCPPVLEFAADEKVWVGTGWGPGQRLKTESPLSVVPVRVMREKATVPSLISEIWEWAFVSSRWVAM